MKQLLKLAICFVLIMAVGFSASAQNATKLKTNKGLISLLKKEYKAPIKMAKAENKTAKSSKMNRTSKIRKANLEQPKASKKVMRKHDSASGKIGRKKSIQEKNTRVTKSESGLRKSKIVNKTSRSSKMIPTGRSSKMIPAKTYSTKKTKVVKTGKVYSKSANASSYGKQAKCSKKSSCKK